jgi:hypothetical protein
MKIEGTARTFLMSLVFSLPLHIAGVQYWARCCKVVMCREVEGITARHPKEAKVLNRRPFCTQR